MFIVLQESHYINTDTITNFNYYTYPKYPRHSIKYNPKQNTAFSISIHLINNQNLRFNYIAVEAFQADLAAIFKALNLDSSRLPAIINNLLNPSHNPSYDDMEDEFDD